VSKWYLHFTPHGRPERLSLLLLLRQLLVDAGEPATT
jgi:hypothetical protein